MSVPVDRKFFLSNPILQMAIHATIRNVLLLRLALIDESIVSESSIISAIVFYYHTACFGHLPA